MTKQDAIQQAVNHFDESGKTQYVLRRGDNHYSTSPSLEIRGWKVAEMIGVGNVQNYRTAEPVKELVGTIDITPEGCKTPEGNARVSAALDAFNASAHEVANCAAFLGKELSNGRTILYLFKQAELTEYCDDLRELGYAIDARRKAQEAFLHAVAGQ